MPPELAESERADIPQGCSGIPTPNAPLALGPDTSRHCTSGGGSRGELHTPSTRPAGGEVRLEGAGRAGSSGPQSGSAAVNLYRLSPSLTSAFSSVGASDAAYPYREVLVMLKRYLYSKRYLLDKDDILYVNCADDPLGHAFGVTRFHYDDVRSLLAKHLTLDLKPANTASASVVRTRERVADTVIRTCDSITDVTDSAARENSLTNLADSEVRTHESVTGTVCREKSLTNVADSVSSSCADVKLSNDNTVTRSNGNTVTRSIGNTATENKSISGSCVDVTSSSSSSTSMSRVGAVGACLKGVASFTVALPDVPDTSSDVESTYSCQGYETALCRNTEFEDSECEDEESEYFEEYELADDDDEWQAVFHSDDDDDDVAEGDFDLALLTLTSLSDSDEDFWADDSDDDSDTDDDEEDPTLRAERWDCLACGVKNKPYVRYCEKCWQLRKNWLPDRPRRPRRKAREKKKQKRPRCDSIMSEDGKAGAKLLAEGVAEIKKSNSTISTASTVSYRGNTPERTAPLDIYSSQDSGIYMSMEGSQDSDLRNSEGFSAIEGSSAAEGSSAVDSTVEKEKVYPSTSKGGQNSSSSGRKSGVDHKQISGSTKRKMLDSDSDNSSDRTDLSGKTPTKKQKVVKAGVTVLEVYQSSSEDDSASSSKDDTSSEGSEEAEDDDDRSKEMLTFLKSDEGKAWLGSPESQHFLSSSAVKEVLMEAIVANMCSDPTAGSQEAPSSLSIMCSICYLRPKNASIIHGRLSHQATCYQCAKRLFNSGQKCPVCRRKIHMVCKHIIA